MDSTTLPIERHELWSDSQTVIKWCTNQDLELRVFERNRVDLIMRNTQGKAPKYVPSGSNPADVATRPCKVSQSDRWNLWTRGPDFLRMPMSNWDEVKTDEVCASIQRIASNPCTSLNGKNTNAGFLQYEVCLKSIGTVCFAQTTLATVIKALFFKMAQCLVVVKM